MQDRRDGLRMQGIPGNVPGPRCKSEGKVNPFQMAQRAVLTCSGVESAGSDKLTTK